MSDSNPTSDHPNEAPRKVDVRRGFRWFVAEFIVVVAGILAALMVQQLHQHNQDRTHERFYMHQLLRDFDKSRVVLRTARDTEARNTDGFTLVWRAIHSGVRPPKDSLADWFRYSGGLSQPRVVSGTLSALVNGGDIGLIRDDSLRSVLIALAASFEDYQNQLNRMAVAVTDLQKQRDVLIDPVEVTADYRDLWGMDGGRFPVDWDALLRDRSFNGFISASWQASVQRWGNINRMLNELEQARRLLAEKLGIAAEIPKCVKGRHIATAEYGGVYQSKLTNVRITPRVDSINLSGFGLGGRFVHDGADHFCNADGEIRFSRDPANRVDGFRIELYGRTYEATRIR